MILKNMCVQTKETVKQFCKENPKALMRSAVCSVGAMIISGSSFICFADSGESSYEWSDPFPHPYSLLLDPYDLSPAVSDSLDALATQFYTYASVVVPVGLVIFGTVFGIHYGIKLFKKTSH